MMRLAMALYLLIAIIVRRDQNFWQYGDDNVKLIQKMEEENRQLKEENKVLKEYLKMKEELSAKNGEDESFNHDFTKGEIWEVPGKWKVQVHHVKVVKDRNHYSEQDPVQVLLVEYTYENLGYDREGEGLYIYTDRILDEEGKMGYVYPLPLDHYPRKTPIGGICDGEQSFGLDHASKIVHVYFEIYDEDLERHSAVFKMPVEY